VYEAAVRDYAWLGLAPEPPVSSFEEYFRFSAEEDVDSELFDLSSWRQPRMLSLVRVARASAKLGVHCADALTRGVPSEEMRQQIAPDLGTLAERTFTEAELAILGGEIASLVDLDATPMELLDTALAVRAVDGAPDSLRQTVQELAEVGLLDARAGDFLDAWFNLSDEDWRLLDGRLPFAQLSNADQMFTLPFILSASWFSGRDCAEVYEALCRIGPTVGVDVPPAFSGVTGLEGVRSSGADVAACDRANLLSSAAFPGPDGVWKTPAGAAVLAQHAFDSRWTFGESVAALSRYVPLGGPWRSEPSGEAWESHRATPHDVAMFGEDLLGTDDTVTPLDLVRVAARFGWSLGHAWDRVALFRPFGVDLQAPKPHSDVVPCWEDLILLTERLSGREPAVDPLITERRIAFLAREVERPTRWVMDRYALYADLFGLTLPDSCPDEPLPMPEAVAFRPDATPGDDTHG
jgi:hypothetical protein